MCLDRLAPKDRNHCSGERNQAEDKGQADGQDTAGFPDAFFAFIRTLFRRLRQCPAIAEKAEGGDERGQA
ncbi:MAG: hypothetical protein AAFX77_09020 [Pseudomonadota bacterium]